MCIIILDALSLKVTIPNILAAFGVLKGLVQNNTTRITLDVKSMESI